MVSLVPWFSLFSSLLPSFLLLLSPSLLNPVSMASRASLSRTTGPESFNSWAQKHDDRQQCVKGKTVSFKLIRGLQWSFKLQEMVKRISNLQTWYAKSMMPKSISDMVTIKKITFETDNMIVIKGYWCPT